MVSPIAQKRPVDPKTQIVGAPSTFSKTIAQDPSHVKNGKIGIFFTPEDVGGGFPDALKLDGKVYAVERRIAGWGGPGGGAQGGSLYFEAQVPAFTKDGAHQAELRINNKWETITLNVLIALHT